MTAGLLLETALSAELYRLLLVFCRVSTALLLLPGFGDGAMPPRMRVLASMAIALCMAPLAGQAIPVPGSWAVLAALVSEIAVGMLIGTLARIIISALQMAGQVIGQCIGVANIFTVGIGLDSSATIGAALHAGCLAALFAVDGHHVALRAIANSYTALPLGVPPGLSGSARSISETVAQAFHLALQLSLPFLLLTLLFNLALAGMNRAMPAVPVFMIGAPALLFAGLQLLGVTAPTILTEILGAYALVFQPLR